MTEQEWQTCNHPRNMVPFLRGKVSERKLRLALLALCRRIKDLLGDHRSRRAVEVLELYIEGQASAEELADAAQSAHDAEEELDNLPYDAAAVTAADAAECPKDGYDLVDILEASAMRAGLIFISAKKSLNSKTRSAALDAEIATACGLIRDVVGNPFRSLPVIDSWLLWNDGTIPKIAQAIYDERAFDRMPILADALEDAGCDDADILRHCREPGEHVRGCWVVDLLLGKA